MVGHERCDNSLSLGHKIQKNLPFLHFQLNDPQSV
jgi:hypothetical protein